MTKSSILSLNKRQSHKSWTYLTLKSHMEKRRIGTCNPQNISLGSSSGQVFIKPSTRLIYHDRRMTSMGRPEEDAHP